VHQEAARIDAADLADFVSKLTATVLKLNIHRLVLDIKKQSKISLKIFRITESSPTSALAVIFLHNAQRRCYLIHLLAISVVFMQVVVGMIQGS
ncbi:hypothetical protein M8C21_027713, partial [Ambrosia artemisiifolia]